MEVHISNEPKTFQNAEYRPEYLSDYERLFPALKMKRKIVKISADTVKELEDCIHTFIVETNNRGLYYSLALDPEDPCVAYFIFRRSGVPKTK